MLLKNGRISWPLFLSLVYCTFVLIATDLAWRMLAGPALLFAGVAVVVLLAGCSAILALSKRWNQVNRN